MRKKGRGGDLGVDVERGERVEERERGRDEENTRGTPNPQEGFAAPERKKKKKRKTSSTEIPPNREREREGRQQLFIHGSGPEGRTNRQ